MDILLSELTAQYPRARVTQPPRLFYNRYQHRVSIEAHKESARYPLWQFRNRLLTQYIDGEIRCRVEGGGLNVFVNNLELAKSILSAADQFDHRFYITELCIDQLGRQYGTVSVPRLRQQGYQYRVYFKTGNKYQFIPDKKQKLLELFIGDRDQYRVSDITLEWLKNSRYQNLWDQTYFYIKDPSLLTFFQLMHADCIDKIYQVVE